MHMPMHAPMHMPTHICLDRSVELVEPAAHFLEQARQALPAGRVGAHHLCSLQAFQPPDGRVYAAVWVQWVLNYLTDDDLVCVPLLGHFTANFHTLHMQLPVAHVRTAATCRVHAMHAMRKCTCAGGLLAPLCCRPAPRWPFGRQGESSAPNHAPSYEILPYRTRSTSVLSGQPRSDPIRPSLARPNPPRHARPGRTCSIRSDLTCPLLECAVSSRRVSAAKAMASFLTARTRRSRAPTRSFARSLAAQVSSLCNASCSPACHAPCSQSICTCCAHTRE